VVTWRWNKHMNTHRTHLTTTTNPQGKEAALRWLAQQLRWERLLTDLRDPTTAGQVDNAAEEDEAA